MLVVASPAAFQPLREAGVERSPLRPQQALVGDLAGERVLDHVLPLSGNRGTGLAVHEVPFLKQAEVRFQARYQVTHGIGPKDPPDHGGRLQRRLLTRGQQIDARREHRLNGVRHQESGRELTEGPAAVGAS